MDNPAQVDLVVDTQLRLVLVKLHLENILCVQFHFEVHKGTVSGHMFLRFCLKSTFYMSITDIFTMLLIKPKI